MVSKMGPCRMGSRDSLAVGVLLLMSVRGRQALNMRAGGMPSPHVRHGLYPHVTKRAAATKAGGGRPDSSNFLENIGSPMWIAAPMVEHSEAAFRYLVRRHGIQLAFTQMIHSGQFAEPAADKLRETRFDGVNDISDRPLVIQFCGNDPDTLVRAAQYVEGRVDAVDLNLGCPQKIARKGNYGAFLLPRQELCERIISTMSRELSVPVTVKIRCLEKDEDTLLLGRRLEAAGAAMLTVHGRTVHQAKTRQGQARWNTIRLVKEELSIPVVANGGVETRADAARALEETGADAVMSSEALLEDPSLFDEALIPMDELRGLEVAHRILSLSMEYMDLVRQYPAPIVSVKGHLFKMMYRLLNSQHDLRERLGSRSVDSASAEEIVKEMCVRYYFDPETRQPILDPSEAPFVPISSRPWYRRHWETDTEPVDKWAGVATRLKALGNKTPAPLP